MNSEIKSTNKSIALLKTLKLQKRSCIQKFNKQMKNELAGLGDYADQWKERISAIEDQNL